MGKASEGDIFTSSSRHLSSGQSIDEGSGSDCSKLIAETPIHSLVMVCACHNSTYSYTLHIYPTTASTPNIMRMPLDQDWCLCNV